MSPTLLLVDDEPNLLRSVTRTLRARGDTYEVLHAASADEAYGVLTEREVDLVLLDVAMPGRSGFDLLRQMADERLLDRTPVVMLTGLGDSQMRRKALDIGAADLLTKPVDPDDLVARVRNTLLLKSYADRLRSHETELEAMVAARTAELERRRHSLVVRLAKVSEMRDETTGNHVVRVGCYAAEVARQMGLDASFRELILLSSPMHDIGKLAVPDAILRKPGPLTPEEWEVMRTHCELGARMLEEEPRMLRKVIGCGNPVLEGASDTDPVLEMAARIARTHHERWDGKGYPNRLAGLLIPLEARIVAVVDAFDALTTPRSYRRAVADNVALQILMGDQGSHFDHDVFDAFVECFPRIKAIKRALSDDEGEEPVAA